MVTVKRELLNQVPDLGYPIFPIDLYMKTPWDKM